MTPLEETLQRENRRLRSRLYSIARLRPLVLEKLKVYHDATGGEYHGGVEYTDLVERILKTLPSAVDGDP